MNTINPNATVPRRDFLILTGAAVAASPLAILAAEANPAIDPHVAWETEEAEADRQMQDCNNRAFEIDDTLPKPEIPDVGAWFESLDDAGKVVERRFYKKENVFDAIRQFRRVWGRAPKWAPAIVAEVRESARQRRRTLAEIERMKVESGAAALFEEGDRLCEISCDLRNKIEETRAYTFAGFAVQIRYLMQFCEDSVVEPDSALMQNIAAFVSEHEARL